MYSFGVCFILNFCGKVSVSVPGLLPSENGFFLTVLRKTVVAYFFGVHLFLLGLGKVAVTYQSLLHYSNSLKQVLKARILSTPLFLCVFLLLSQTQRGFLPGLLGGRSEVWDLFLVTILLKLSLYEHTVVQKKHRICIPFLQ